MIEYTEQVKKRKVAKQIKKNRLIDLAVAQFIGFKHGRWNAQDIVGLVDGMGLIKHEWEKIKKDEIGLFVEKDIKEIDKYFESKP